MKKKEKEVKKNLSLGELRAEIVKLREKQFRMQFKHRVTPLQNALELRTIRRDIARIETFARRNEIKTAGATK